MPKEIIYSKDILRKMQAGVDQLADAVKVTLGPKGRNVLLSTPSGLPMITNDGAAIAQNIELEDKAENAGAQIIREAASRTNDLAGDGTTTATVLAQFIVREELKNITAGANPIELKKGIQGAVQVASAALKKLSAPVRTRETLVRIASIASKDSNIGELIADALEQVGRDGVITAEESHNMETTLEVKKGIQFERGLLSPYMATDPEHMITELTNPYILITDREITNAQELLPILEQVKKQGRSLLIIAEKIEGEALSMLNINKLNGTLQVAAVNPPAYGDGRIAAMEDLAAVTGGAFLSETMGYVLRETTLDQLGSAASVRIEGRNTIISGGSGSQEAVEERIRYIRMLLEKAKYDFDREKLKERLAKLISGIAVIHVGAATEPEMKEKKLRIEDALNAARAAFAEGIVSGGGVALINTRPAVNAYVQTLSNDRKTGAEIILKALEEPARRIAANAGMNGDLIAAEIKRQPPGIGFHVMKEEYTNMLEAGIIDPVLVTRLALINAASASTILLTSQAGVMDL